MGLMVASTTGILSSVSGYMAQHGDSEICIGKIVGADLKSGSASAFTGGRDKLPRVPPRADTVP